MASIDASGPNAEQIRYWNEQGGPKWVQYQHDLDSMLRPITERLLSGAGVRTGERILDIGCGCGQTSLELARRTGSGGGVTCIDISEPMLEQARKSAQASGLPNMEFANADAQQFEFARGRYDLAISRFGVMFFSEPVKAFGNIRQGLRNGGRLAFVCWRGLLDNPWVAVPMMAAAQLVSLPAPPAAGAPGPFAFADGERVKTILEQAGFQSIAVEPFSAEVTFAGKSATQAAEFLTGAVGPLASILREAGPEAAQKVVSAVSSALKPQETSTGVTMSGSCWIVTANNPG